MIRIVLESSEWSISDTFEWQTVFMKVWSWMNYGMMNNLYICAAQSHMDSVHAFHGLRIVCNRETKPSISTIVYF